MFTIKTSITFGPLSLSHRGPSFFPFFSQQPACIILSYSFFSLSQRHNITHSSNHNFLSGAHTFFLIISNFIFYNCLNSIHKLIYDRQRKDNTYTMSKYFLFFFFFSFHAFFLDFAGSNLFFSFAARLLFLFSFFFHVFFFSSLGVELSFFCFFPFFLGALYRQLSFLFFSFFGGWGCAAFCFSCFWLLFLVSFFWGPCVFSHSFHHLNKPFEIDPMFLAVSLIVSLIHVYPVRNHAMNDMS